MMSDELNEKLHLLESEGDKLIEVGKGFLEHVGPSEYSTFVVAILNRTINLNRGFISLINDNNYIAAAPLVRLNLDSLLRLFASIQSQYDVNTFAKKIREGNSVRNMNYHKNPKKQLTDTKLVSLLQSIEGFNWVKDIYEAGSGFVHMSHQHIYASIEVEKPNRIVGGIRRTDEFVPTREKVAAAYYMQKSSRGIRILIGDVLSELKNT